MPGLYGTTFQRPWVYPVEAVAYAREIHDSHGLWIGRRVRMRCVPRSLKMRELTWGQLKSICDSTLMIEWRVRLVDVQARPVRKPPDNRYHLGTPTEAEEWYADRTVIKHNSIWGESPKRTGDHRLGMTPRAPQTKPPGSTTMHRSQRHTLALGPGEIRSRRGHPLGRGRPDKCPRSFVIFFILTWASISQPRGTIGLLAWIYPRW